jgi:hypothetical protein
VVGVGVNEVVNGSDSGEEVSEGAVVVVVEPGPVVVVVGEGEVKTDGSGVVVVDEESTWSADFEELLLLPRKLR